MNNQTSPADTEFTAIQTVYAALEPLDEAARGRVISYVTSRLAIMVYGASEQRVARGSTSVDEQEGVPDGSQKNGQLGFSTLADLHDAAQPKTEAENALVAGYWIQVCQGSQTFDSQTINKELKHLGHGIGNITQAIEALKSQQPSLVIQTQKKGTSRQARKTYKLTVAGVKTVEGMING